MSNNLDITTATPYPPTAEMLAEVGRCENLWIPDVESPTISPYSNAFWRFVHDCQNAPNSSTMDPEVAGLLGKLGQAMKGLVEWSADVDKSLQSVSP